MDQAIDIRFLTGIIRRRKWGFAIIFFSLSMIGACVAFILPPIYLSKSTILIETQIIPQEFVRTTITSYVEERLQSLTQQIMSRSRLTEIINRFNLYQDMRGRYTVEEIIEKMRDDIHFKTISSDVMDRRTGRSTAATIAFSLSYEGKDPSSVQRVANVLASLYLEENLRSREQRASNTTTFLQQELDELKGQVDSFQNQISEFKMVHTGELPEHNPVNLQTVARLNRDLDNVNMQINSLKERKVLLEGQLVHVDPLKAIVTEEGKAVMNPGERVKYLRMQLISLQSSLSERHPDVKKLKNEIRDLEAQVGESDDAMEKVRRLNDLNGQLAIMKGKLGERHPDVVKLSKEVETLSNEVGSLKTAKAATELVEQRPDNPAYINLKTQMASTDLEIKNLLEQRVRIEEEVAKYQKRVDNSPLLEKEYNNLIRNYENARHKSDEITNKLMEARLSQGMEQTQRGERFTIIEPAQSPEKPYKPNRMAIILIGFVLAVGAGVGFAAIREVLDTSIKTSDELGRLSGIPVLSVIPLLESDEERRSRRIKWILLILAAMGLFALSLFLFDRFIMPLDIFWIKIQRRVAKLSII